MEQYQGKITKGVGGNYEVHVEGIGTVLCRAKGILRYRRMQPLIGDNVTITVDDTGAGNIAEILPRENELVRPAIANVDQALLVCAIREPEFHPNLLDRFLILMSRQNMPVLVCFNKTDLAETGEAEQLCRIYGNCGARVFITQASNPETLKELRDALRGKTTVLAGPSGVGKSTIMNAMQPEAAMEIGELSEKIKRGKQTTRHTQLFCIEHNTYLCDTPGFSSLYLADILPEELGEYFPEFTEYAGQCRYPDCRHLQEPDCAVRSAVESGAISKERYASYQLLFEELSGRRIIYSRKPKHEDSPGAKDGK
ncbi:MAG: ribosome small subunit-dependent GTPase A [Lachnospiraceae bacterium]|nr:ribosome small subunit-dependent GTPase A [Lachnospiraceae bacterium]